MLNISNVTKEYPVPSGSFTALECTDLVIEGGQFVCILGASGCGKTTLLNLIAGFEKPSGGRITLNDKVVGGPAPERMMFFQDSGEALFPWLTVEQNVEFGLAIQQKPRKDRQAIIDHHLSMVGLADDRHKYPAQLSGGMRQRLQIARALAISPDLLLMDEPFAALDALTKRRMQFELLNIWEKTHKTVIFVTHDIGEAITLSDRIIVMSRRTERQIASDIEVDTPRPRTADQPEFGKLYRQIEDLLRNDLSERI